jgi:hypothetical protein
LGEAYPSFKKPYLLRAEESVQNLKIEPFGALVLSFRLEILVTVRKQRLKALLNQSFRILLRLLFSESDKTGLRRLSSNRLETSVKTIQNSKLLIQNCNQWGLETHH